MPDGSTYYPVVQLPQYDPIMTDRPEDSIRLSGVNRPLEVITEPSIEPDTGGRTSRTSRTSPPPEFPVDPAGEYEPAAPRETGRGTFTNTNRPVSISGGGAPYDLDAFKDSVITGQRRVRSDARDTSEVLTAPRSTGLSSGTTNTAARDWRREAIQTGRNPDTGEPIVPRTLDDTGRSEYIPPDPLDPFNPSNPPGTGGGAGGGFYYPGSGGGGGSAGGISINAGGGGSGGGYVGTAAGAFSDIAGAFGGWLPVVMVGLVISILWYNE